MGMLQNPIAISRTVKQSQVSPPLPNLAHLKTLNQVLSLTFGIDSSLNDLIRIIDRYYPILLGSRLNSLFHLLLNSNNVLCHNMIHYSGSNRIDSRSRKQLTLIYL